MKITNLRIKNFRTITQDQTINLQNGVTLVGPNNSGKTNALLGIYLFFTGHENKYGYDPERDLPFSSKNTQTSLTCFFEADPETDKDILAKLQKLRHMLKSSRDEATPNQFSINVYFNKSAPVYQVYPGAKKADGKSAQYSTLQKSIVISVLESFQCYYIPSNKSIPQLYEEFVSPFVKRKAAAALEAYDEKIRESISSLTDSMNAELKSSGLSGVRSILEYPKNALENLISGFDLMVQDSRKSSIFSKGMGIQSAVLLSSFKWITLQHPDKNVLWLIEEPETFMHPKLAYQSAKILQQLSDLSTVIKTTHSLSFMPQSAHDVQGVQINPKGGTTLQSYETLQQATESIRESLGVKFSDYFGLTDLNVFVEGETDIIYLEEIAGHYQNFIGRDILLSSGEVQYRDFGGVTGLKGFLRANYDLIRKEVVVVTLFDGDEAGRKSISELAGFHGKKGGFNGNSDYVVIPGRVEMEALFPDEWILEAHNEYPEWFDLFIEDASGGASEFKIRDESKKAFMKLMLELADDALDYSFLDKFLPVLDSIENALITRAKKLWPDRDFYKKWDIED